MVAAITLTNANSTMAAVFTGVAPAALEAARAATSRQV